MITTGDITTRRGKKSAVALGFFDGVHLGHRAVIGSMTKAAADSGLLPMVFTFSPDGSIPASKSGLTLLQTQTHKELIMESMGVRELVSPDFSDFRELSPEQFVGELLHSVLNAGVLVCGENYRFGKAACAGVEELKHLSETVGMKLITVPPVLYEGEAVSSTRIRKALREGRTELAQAMLGTPFVIEGRVLHGKMLGRSIGSPTINQTIPHDFTIPAYGVYLSRVTTPEGDYWGVTNIGVRPTVGGGAINCETYLIGFEGSLYGETVAVALRRQLRTERKFQNVQELSEQIQVDIHIAKEIAKELQ